ncbi:outer membrane protein OmpA-like peptidoglycan-associated protein [Humitalea rosea]|uniref:Outer membrane protein OmpA-like peptidoglycan-associated protein n=1 Tax=Humitalea rosea TaxID=990373 RepID=A0A2W7IU25_9PROT|nr:OmpA family protein [Humitalea rosea]PZW51014.1 outer membrane protein OmpA-like peptidoglycan-associated protein [Humitalea rosea]
MSRTTAFTLVAAMAGAMAAGSPVLAQSDPAALSLIERLRPSVGGPSGTRGIRVPSADPGAALPPATTPVLVPAAPAYSSPPARPPRQQQAIQAAPPPAAPRETTAPPGVAAASITVLFPTGSAALTQQAMAALAPLGRALTSPDLAPYRFRIEGHTDTTGDGSTNLALSQRRAESVRDYLSKTYGVAPARLEAVGLGESELLVPTGDKVDEPRNRRVQVLNLGA